MFDLNTPEANPQVIYTRDKLGRESHEVKRVNGFFYRVFPIDGREIFALRMLEHHKDKFAPASGNGVLITQDAFYKFNPNKLSPIE